MVVAGVSAGAFRAVRLGRGAAKGGFAASAEPSVAEEAAISSGAVSAVSLLAVQEAESDARQDREGRRHGEQMIDELGVLQRALLGGGDGDLDRLARLAERPVQVSDPTLAGLLRAIQVRAAVELVRRGR